MQPPKYGQRKDHNHDVSQDIEDRENYVFQVDVDTIGIDDSRIPSRTGKITLACLGNAECANHTS